MLSWYVAQIEWQKGIAAEQSVAARGFEVFNPKIKSVRKWSRGRSKEITKCYVSGYLFVRFDVDVPGWELINRLPGSGVKTLMYAASEIPARIRDEALVPLMSLCDADGFLNELEADKFLFEVGVQVKVISGPFTGFTGTVTLSTYDRLKVLVHMFGRPSEIAGKANMFELVKE